MNVPEYRRAIFMAQEKYQAAINEATEVFNKELSIANDQFFQDQAEVGETIRR